MPINTQSTRSKYISNSMHHNPHVILDEEIYLGMMEYSLRLSLGDNTIESNPKNVKRTDLTGCCRGGADCMAAMESSVSMNDCAC